MLAFQIVGWSLLSYVVILSWVCGAQDAKGPAWVTGRTRGAILVQASPFYKLSFWLYSVPK